jgi:hypothetical protein
MTECLSCPQPENYAAVALQLQNTALQTEACVFDLENQLRIATSPLTTIITSTGVESIAANVLTDLGVTSFTINFSKWTANQLVSLGPNLPTGVYQVGVMLTATAAGVVDDNSLRVLRIRTKKSGTPTAAAADFSDEITIYEPNNGVGSDMSLFTTVTLNGNQELLFSFIHTNTSSLINIAAGARYWWSKLSDQVALRTV